MFKENDYIIYGSTGVCKIDEICTPDCGKKLGQTDMQYMKQAEDLLYGEFAVALGISIGEVKKYIADRIK